MYRNVYKTIGKLTDHKFNQKTGSVTPTVTFQLEAIRETKEEIGCDVKLIKYLGYKDFRIEGKNFRSRMFLARLESGQMPKIKEPERFRDIFWLPIKNYREYSVAPNVRQFCEDYIKRGLDVLHDV